MRPVLMAFVGGVEIAGGHLTLRDISPAAGAPLPDAPTQYPLTIYFEFEVAPEDEGQIFHLRLDIEPADPRHPAATLEERHVEAPRRAHPRVMPIMGQEFSLADMLFPEPGQYVFRLYVDGAAVAHRTFTLIPV